MTGFQASRRGVLGALAGLVAGGRQVAAQVNSAVGFTPPLNYAAAQSPASPSVGMGQQFVPSALDIARDKLYGARNRRDNYYIHSSMAFSPHIAALRSVPLATKARMQREEFAREVGPLARAAIALGVPYSMLPTDIQMVLPDEGEPP